MNKNEDVLLGVDKKHRTLSTDFFNMDNDLMKLISIGGKISIGKSFSSDFRDDKEYKSLNECINKK